MAQPPGAENWFDDPRAAAQWIETIESEKGKVREGDVYPRLRAWVDLAAPREILEIGCGQGVCSDQIELEGRGYTGVDSSGPLLKRAQELYAHENRRFLPGSAYALPLADGAVDAAFSISVWHLLEDLQQASRELARVLRSGGHFLVMTANPMTYSAWTEPYIDQRRDGARFEGKVRLSDGTTLREILYLHSWDEIISALQSTGLEIRGTDTFRMYFAIQGRCRDGTGVE